MSNTVTIQAALSTYVDNQNVSSNYVSATQLQCFSERYRAIVQFEIPSSLAYKIINKATINYTLVSNYSTCSYGQKFYGYIASNTLCCDSITYSTYESNVYGNKSSLNKYGSSSGGSSTSKSINMTDDITSYYANAVTNSLFTFVIAIVAEATIDKSISLVIDYDDVQAVAPTLASPVMSYVNRDNPITFSWAYNTDSGASQKSFTLKYTNMSETGASEQTIEVEQAESSYTFPAKYFTVGTYKYKLCTTDITDLTSPYAQSTFTVLGSPNIPIMDSVTNECLPTISWNATTQQSGFSLSILQDGEEVYQVEKTTTDNFHKCGKVLENGDYEVHVKVVNVFNYWSEEAIYLFTINATPPGTKPVLLTVQNKDYVEFINKSESTKCVLYKKENKVFYPVHIFTENEEKFIDCNIRKDTEYKFFTRAIDGGYKDSDVSSVVLQYDGFSISDTETKEDLNIITSKDELLEYSNSLQTKNAISYFAGRELPVCEFSITKVNSVSRTFCIHLKEFAILKKFQESRNTLLYKDEYGNNFYCVITQFNTKNINAYEDFINVSISLQQVDFREEVDLIE